MNFKKLFTTAATGTFVYYLLGFLVYGILLTNLYPSSGEENMLFIFLGCMFYGILVAYVVACKADAKDFMSGLKVGAMLGFLGAISMNFFMHSNPSSVETMDLNNTKFILDVVASTLMVAITGGLVAVVNHKVS